MVPSNSMAHVGVIRNFNLEDLAQFMPVKFDRNDLESNNGNRGADTFDWQEVASSLKQLVDHDGDVEKDMDLTFQV